MRRVIKSWSWEVHLSTSPSFHWRTIESEEVGSFSSVPAHEVAGRGLGCEPMVEVTRRLQQKGNERIWEQSCLFWLTSLPFWMMGGENGRKQAERDWRKRGWRSTGEVGLSWLDRKEPWAYDDVVSGCLTPLVTIWYFCRTEDVFKSLSSVAVIFECITAQSWPSW